MLVHSHGPSQPMENHLKELGIMKVQIITGLRVAGNRLA